MSRDPPKREPYAPLHELDAKGSEASVRSRPSPTQAPIPHRPGKTLEPAPQTQGAAMAKDEDSDEKVPAVTPEGALQRGMTHASAMVRRFMGPQADEATYTLRFHRMAGTTFFLVMALYFFGHGLYGWFPCAKEVLVVAPIEGPSRKDLLKQDGGQR